MEEVTFAPVRPKTAFDETQNRLENAVKLGLLPPGSRLPAERELCTQLGISRSTLRQALRSLTSSGYVFATRGRGGGTFVVDRPPPVPPPSDEDLAGWAGICEERLAIELGVVALAARHATPDSAVRLQELATEMHSCADPVRFCQLDRQFHIAIAELTGSPPLILASTAIQAAIFDVMATIVPTDDQREFAMDGHNAIIAALLTSNEQVAISAMCSHLRATTALFDHELATQAAR